MVACCLDPNFGHLDLLADCHTFVQAKNCTALSGIQLLDEDNFN